MYRLEELKSTKPIMVPIPLSRRGQINDLETELQQAMVKADKTRATRLSKRRS